MAGLAAWLPGWFSSWRLVEFVLGITCLGGLVFLGVFWVGVSWWMLVGGEELLSRIVVDPRVMGGKPVIRGTRITVDLILELLGRGMSVEEVARDYGLSVDDIRAALLYAARVLGREEVLVVVEKT